MRLTSSAPTRIDLAGGTLDIWPLYLFHEGAQTLNVAISVRATATIESAPGDTIVVRSVDTERSLRAAHWSELRVTRELPLLARILYALRARGLALTTSSGSPAGAGIAGSSAMAVAVTAGLARFMDVHYEDEALLTLVMNLEAQAIAVPTGLQDYRPALYGGLAAIELGPDGARRVPLRVDVDELEAHLLLAYTGRPRHSGVNNWEIYKRHIDGDTSVRDAFDRIRDEATAMREALVQGDWSAVARHVTAEWHHRRGLASTVSTPEIDALLARALDAGALAGKVCGAGGGGCVCCLVAPSRKAAVRQVISDSGARMLDFHVDTEGLQVQ